MENSHSHANINTDTKINIKEVLGFLYPATLLEKVFPENARKFARDAVAIVLVIFLVGTQVVGVSAVPKVFGMVLLLLCVLAVFCMLEAYFFSYYFPSFSEGNRAQRSKVSYPVATLLVSRRGALFGKSDAVTQFLQSDIATWVMLRAGLGAQEISRKYIEARVGTPGVAHEEFLAMLEKKWNKAGVDGGIALGEYVATLIDSSPKFLAVILQGGATRNDLIEAAAWYERKAQEEMYAARWWSKERLARVPGIGKNWSYGTTYRLDKYAMNFSEVVHGRNFYIGYGTKEADAIERILVRAREANALLVGDKAAGAMDVIYRLARQVAEGTIFPELEHKRFVALDTRELIAFTKEKNAFEAEFILIMNEAARAGNIILFIDDLPDFVQNARTMGSDIVPLLTPYLVSNNVQILAISDPRRYHEVIESNIELSRHFERVKLEATEGAGLVSLVESLVSEAEHADKVFFTVQAVREIAKSAEQYFAENAGVDRVKDLVVELVPYVRKHSSGRHSSDHRRIWKTVLAIFLHGWHHTAIVTASDVLELVEEKTGIPLGEITATEKDTLLNLEDFLKQRIIGQKEAVKAISDAMRRARAGVANPNRPMGSFLFLGPTGVGKTETTKALAESFFGSESHITRFDMSEYRTADALERLIGSFDDGRTGVLSSKLREQQYGVVLLDEFEKTLREVHDLFLQVLDEGFFSDMRGTKVNMRNCIIIATSNAASQYIWEAVQAGKNLEDEKPRIIDAIVEQGIFKPELLNRFDGIVLFHPLLKPELTLIAGLMLKKLAKRLEEKGVRLAWDPDVIEFLVEKGSDPKFGARAMNRAIQERIEQLIADKMIRGDIHNGSEYTLRAEDLG